MEDDADGSHLQLISNEEVEVSRGMVAALVAAMAAAKKHSKVSGDLSCSKTEFPVSDGFPEHPPVDDRCPICFGDYNIPGRTSCGHWFCAGCILMFWNQSSALTPCKCPICSALVTKFTPQASLMLEQNEKVINTLKEVQTYNDLFVGGARGLIMKTFHVLLAIMAFFKGRFSADKVEFTVPLACLIADMAAILYKRCGFDFIPRGYMEVDTLFEYTAMAFAVILYLYDFNGRGRAARPVANPET